MRARQKGVRARWKGARKRTNTLIDLSPASETIVMECEDPHKWLEDVLGEEPMKWVASKNEEAFAAIGDPTSTSTYKRILAILDSKDKIPNLYRIGGPDGFYYNYWQDDVHVQGIWRKTTLESYKSGTPDWKTVIDVDALEPPKLDTAKSWVWHGSTLLDDGPGTICDRAIIALSPGGSDADTRREFDLMTQKWVEVAEGGFAMPTAAKTQLSWRSRDEILVGTDFGGDGKCLTDSGYPRVIKSWKRGTPIEDAKFVFEGERSQTTSLKIRPTGKWLQRLLFDLAQANRLMCVRRSTHTTTGVSCTSFSCAP